MVGMVNTFKHLFIPHHTNNHRPQILQPIGLAVLMGLFLVLQTWTQLLAYAPLPRGVVLGYASSIDADSVIQMTNAERAKAGLTPLTHNALLSQAAAAKAANMFALDYWAHIAPDGTTPWVFIKNAGYAYTVAGENLARDFGDTSSMVEAWMNSPTHKENIINTKYTEIGVAVVNGNLEGTETTLVVQMFGKPATAGKAVAVNKTVPAATTEVKVEPTITKSPTLEASTPAALNHPLTTPLTETGVTLASNKIAGTQNQKLISPLTLTKSVAVSIMILLIVVLIYDEYLIHARQIPRRVGKNWAHLSLFGIVLMMIVALTPGRII